MPGIQRLSARSLPVVTCAYSTIKILPISSHSLSTRVLKQYTNWQECVQFESASSKAGVLSIVDRRWLQRHAGSRYILTAHCNGWTRSSRKWVHLVDLRFTPTLKKSSLFFCPFYPFSNSVFWIWYPSSKRWLTRFLVFTLSSTQLLLLQRIIPLTRYHPPHYSVCDHCHIYQWLRNNL